MKTKTIFKTMALAMLMPAMLLTASCNKNEDITKQEGYQIPVTVNVTREGDDATKATYTDNGDGTGSLGFSTGDKLFVSGLDGGYGIFAGTLTWTSGGTFSGTIYTNNSYEGTAQDYLSSAYMVNAYLLPNDYTTYGYLSISGDGYSASIGFNNNNAFASTKALAVEQFSREAAGSYSSGFALSPRYAILNFTITGLTPSTEVTATLTNGSTLAITGLVTTDGSGNATFAMGVADYTDLNSLSLTVGGNDITLVSSTKHVEAGKIYNINRSAAPALTYPIALSAVTSDYVGSVVTTDGNVYATVAAASAASKTAVAVIAYVGTAGSVDASSDTYKGLAVALSDANSGSNCKWAESFEDCLSSSQTSDIVAALGFKNGITCTSTLTAAGHSSHGHAAATAAASNNGTAAPTGTSGWFMPSMGQWNLIVQGLATKKAGSAVTTDLTTSVNNTYKADNLNSVITDAGGTGFKTNSYWASTEQNSVRAWAIYFTNGNATNYAKSVSYYVRSIIAF